ncbi:MAG TPA: YggT family protein [bacterium]|nr:YggT family protein [bacterium]
MDVIALIKLLFQAFYVLLIIRVLLSWVPGVAQDHPAVDFVFRATSPLLTPIRRVMPPVGGLDLSPLVAILLLTLVQSLVINLLEGAVSY